MDFGACWQALHWYTHIPVTLFSGATSVNLHDNTLQQNATPKSKGDQNQKSSRATGGPRSGLPRCADTFIAAYLQVFPLSRGSSAQSSWWLQGEFWPEVELPDLAAEFWQLRDATNFPARAGDFKVYSLQTPAGISPEFIQKNELLQPLYNLSPTSIHSVSWALYILRFTQNFFVKL